MQPTSELLQTTQCLCLASRRAARTITRTFDAALRPLGLRSTQFSMLTAMQLKGTQSIHELANLLGAERTTISRNLAVAEKAGWAQVQSSAHDARVRMVHITADGERKLREALPAWKRTQSNLLADIGDEAARAMRRLAGGPCTLLDSATASQPGNKV